MSWYAFIIRIKYEWLMSEGLCLKLSARVKEWNSLMQHIWITTHRITGFLTWNGWQEARMFRAGCFQSDTRGWSLYMSFIMMKTELLNTIRTGCCVLYNARQYHIWPVTITAIGISQRNITAGYTLTIIYRKNTRRKSIW